jgi:tetratricopeptide (TPR) repeat protein
MVTTATFENDGHNVRTVRVRVRINSEAGVQQFGLLRFGYQRSTETLDFDYIRVHKADGTVVTTPPENVQDQTSQISQIAPLYSDLREKHAAVRGLGNGDTLEYLCRWKVNNPLAPGQFWLDYSFQDGGVVLDEQLEVRVPRGRQINVKSPSSTPSITNDGDYRLYVWKHSNLQSKPEDSEDAKRDKLWQIARGRLDPTDVRISSFQTWAEVGRWYGDLQKDRVVPDPVIQAKAAQLTKDASDDQAKLRAIYHYVSTQFRYIGLDFGIGRYQPHKATEVLDNQYGDCKDKHTLLAALLAAVGIKAQPALVSATHEVDPDVPSPSQFDHVITFGPLARGPVWLDSTLEVAPFGHLVSTIRDKHALVIPDDKAPSLEVTPANPPYREDYHFSLTGKLGDDGVLDAEVERSARGDAELLLRAAFRRVPQTQWKDLVQGITYSTGFAGDVSDVAVSSPENTDTPLRITYKYHRKDYSDWKDKQITPPLPLSGLFIVFKDEDKKPANPIWLGAPGELVMDAKLELPKGYVTKTPPSVDVENDFIEYHSKCEVKDGVMVAQRRLIIKQREVPAAQFEVYKSLQKTASDDEDKYTTFTANTEDRNTNPETALTQRVGATFQEEFWKLPISSNREAQRLEEQGRLLWQQNNLDEALNLLQQAVAADPKFARAWVDVGQLQLSKGHPSEGLDAYRKAIVAEPKQPYPYKALGFTLMGMHKLDEAIPVWRDLAKTAPDDEVATLNLGTLLLATKQYSDAVDPLEKATHRDAKSAHLQISLGDAYLHTNNKEKAEAAFAKALELDSSASMLRNVAYSMAEVDTNLDDALQYAQKAVRQAEETSQKIQLPSLKNEDLLVPAQLATYWDTLGWVYFRKGQLDLAEKALSASWQLNPISIVAEHLGQVYEEQQKRLAAIHIYRLALATMPPGVRPEDTEAFKRLKKLGGMPERNASTYMAGDQLTKMRTLKLPRPAQIEGSAEYFVLIAPGGKVEATKMLNGTEKFKTFGAILKAVKFNAPFPEGSDGRLLRRGILSCDSYSGCVFVLLPLEIVHSVE